MKLPTAFGNSRLRLILGESEFVATSESALDALRQIKASAFADCAAKTPVGRAGQPEDIAEAIAFLIANTFISGQTIIWDEGLRLTV